MHALLMPLLLCVLSAEPAGETFDLVVYGGTSAGIGAAVQGARMGKTVIVVAPEKLPLGGLSSGGLGWTDSGQKEAVGGPRARSTSRIKRHYDTPDAWKQQKSSDYRLYHQADDAMWAFLNQRVAEKVFEDLVAEHKIPVSGNEWLDRTRGRREEREGGPSRSAR